MREIKFRGKTVDSRELVYGSIAYSENKQKMFIVEFLEVNYRNYEKTIDYCFHEVDPETVCRVLKS